MEEESLMIRHSESGLCKMSTSRIPNMCGWNKVLLDLRWAHEGLRRMYRRGPDHWSSCSRSHWQLLCEPCVCLFRGHHVRHPLDLKGSSFFDSSHLITDSVSEHKHMAASWLLLLLDVCEWFIASGEEMLKLALRTCRSWAYFRVLSFNWLCEYVFCLGLCSQMEQQNKTHTDDTQLLFLTSYHFYNLNARSVTGSGFVNMIISVLYSSKQNFTWA